MIGSTIRSILSLLLLPVAIAMPVAAGELTQLVTDLNPSLRQDDSYGHIREVMDGTVYFTKDSLSYGQELWRSDGTPGGTRLVKDFLHGVDSGDPVFFTTMGGSLYFWARFHKSHLDYGLWKSDGTEEGTVMLTSSWPSKLVSMGDKIYSLTPTGLSGSDGTAAGTGPLSPAVQFSDASGLTAIGDTLYFSANNNSQVGLWKSDGTAAGTVQVKELTQPHFCTPFEFTEWNGETYFTASVREGSTPQRQLWKTDGTEAGTVRVDLLGTRSTGVQHVVHEGETLFFTTSGNELWKTDGTAAGTVLIKAFCLGFMMDAIRGIRMVGETLCLQTSPQGKQFILWRSDGTEAGTVEIGSFTSGYDNAYNLPPLMPHEGKLYFQGSSTSGEGLYVTDGTAIGTHLVSRAQFGSGSLGEVQQDYRSTDEGLFFQAALLRTENGEPFADEGIYVTDGTEAGTRLFLDLDTGTESSQIGAMIPAGDHLYFTGMTEFLSETKLWRTDGSAAGTVEMPLHIEWATSIPFPASTASRNGNLYFRGSRRNMDGSWDYGIMRHHDATGVTTRVLSLPAPGPIGPFSYEPSYFTFLESRTAFIAHKAVHLLDETTGLTEQLLQTQGAWALVTVGGKLYFSARVAGSTWRIWRSDGTSAGTQLIPQNSSSGQSFPQTPISVSETQGYLYFTEGDYYTKSLHRTDGTPGGTLKLATLDLIGKPHEAGDKMFFMASTPAAGRELWVTDGTEAGTHMVKDITAGSADTFYGEDPGTDMAVLGGRIYFSAMTPSYGMGLWTSDGTEAGTYLLKDTFPGGTTFVSEFTLFQGKLLFTTDDGIHGRELWESDGTETGTRMLVDATGNSASSNPLLFTPHGTDLYFTAHTEEYGREIFIYSEGTAAAPVVEQPTVSNVTKASADVNAVVTPNRSVTTAVLEYGTTPAFGSSQSIPLLPRDGRGPQPHNILLRNLPPATTYYFRLFATNGSGTDHSPQGTFTTLENLPPVHAGERRSADYETKLEIPLAELLGGATDPDGDGSLITLSAIGDAASGAILRNGTDSFTYTPNAGFSGKDTVILTFTDGEGASATAELELTVGGPFGYVVAPPVILLVLEEGIYFFSTAVDGKSYLIQRSVDLDGWEDLAFRTSVGGCIVFLDENPFEGTAFYRAKYLGNPVPESGN